MGSTALVVVLAALCLTGYSDGPVSMNYIRHTGLKNV